MRRLTRPFRELLEFYGVYAEYRDAARRWQSPSVETLLAVLRQLGSPIERMEEAAEALAAARARQWRHPLPPLVVAWDGVLPEISLRLPLGAPSRVRCEITTEAEPLTWEVASADVAHTETSDLDGRAYAIWRLPPPPAPVPRGYLRLTVEMGGGQYECQVISAPRRAFAPKRMRRNWGAFVPTYALRSERSWGVGDVTDLEAITSWVQGLGGNVVATLPMLAAFLDEPFDFSPYSPASRLFWNELYVDVARLPEVEHSPAAREMAASEAFKEELHALRGTTLVDYRRTYALKRRVLAELARTLFADGGARREALEGHLRERPQTRDYALFRAVCDRRRASWHTWPSPLREGDIGPGDYDPADYHYHLYAQFVAAEQFKELAERARATGPGLYLDLPLGVNSDSYDVWRNRELFAMKVSTGAPPDPFFPKGQDWGFPPPHPLRIREQGHGHLRDYVRHHLRHAGVLRIDHAMGLHRLYWIPHGTPAHNGVYVRYPAEELYAVFALESHISRSILVGEDLGTVPPEVPRSMRAHRIHRMYVSQYEVGRTEGSLPRVFPASVASVNTHDMPPLSAWWQGLDILDRAELGILDQAAVDQARRERAALRERIEGKLRGAGLLDGDAHPSAVLAALLRHLASDRARLVLVNLEDLWGETQPQNVPGTWQERPNWRRKLPFSLEELTHHHDVLVRLREVEAACRAKRV